MLQHGAWAGRTARHTTNRRATSSLKGLTTPALVQATRASNPGDIPHRTPPPRLLLGREVANRISPGLEALPITSAHTQGTGQHGRLSLSGTTDGKQKYRHHRQSTVTTSANDEPPSRPLPSPPVPRRGADASRYHALPTPPCRRNRTPSACPGRVLQT